MGLVANFIFQQCKTFKNRLRCDKVTESLKVETFLRHIVYLIMLYRISLGVAPPVLDHYHALQYH